MPSSVSGIKSQAIRQVDMRLESDRYGVDMLTLVEEVPAAMFPNQFRAMGETHPEFSSMAIAKRSAERGQVGNFWKVSYTYEGFLNSLPAPTYELSGTLDQQPIATHPNFESIAGTPSSPLNGAVFIDPETGKPTTDNSKGVFREFSIAGGKKAGVDSFMDPGATWTKTSFSVIRPSLRSLGTIDSPAGDNPTLSGRNWLFWDVSMRQRGFIIELRETWKLSGRGGWDSDIY